MALVYRRTFVLEVFLNSRMREVRRETSSVQQHRTARNGDSPIEGPVPVRICAVGVQCAVKPTAVALRRKSTSAETHCSPHILKERERACARVRDAPELIPLPPSL